MDRLCEIYSELKSTVNGELYLANYFTEIRNQIDIGCEEFISEPNLKDDVKGKAIQQQEELINEVNSFQKECLKNLMVNPIKEVDLEKFDFRLKTLDLADNKAVLNLEKDLYCVLHNRKKALFINKGIVLLRLDAYWSLFTSGSKEIYEKKHKKKFDHAVLFALLVLIEDEFLIFNDKLEHFGRNLFNTLLDDTARQKFKVNRFTLYEHHLISDFTPVNDWFDEFLAFFRRNRIMINLFQREFSSSLLKVVPVKVVNRIKLGLMKMKEMLLSGFPLLDSMVINECQLNDYVVKMNEYDMTMNDYDASSFFKPYNKLTL